MWTRNTSQDHDQDWDQWSQDQDQYAETDSRPNKRSSNDINFLSTIWTVTVESFFFKATFDVLVTIKTR